MDLRRLTQAGGGYPFAVGLVLAAAVVLIPLRGMLLAPTLMLILVPVIIIVARLVGPRPSAVAAIVAFLASDFLFVPPYYRFTVAAPAEWIGLIVFLIVALVSAQQTAQLRDRERSAVSRQGELALLNRLSFRIASEMSPSAIAQFVADEIAQVSSARRVALYMRDGRSGAPECIGSTGDPSSTAAEIPLVGWVLHTSKAIGMPSAHDVPFEQRFASVDRDAAIPGVVAEGVYVPLQTSTSLEGVLFVDFAEPDRPTSDEARLLGAVANLAASTIERQRLQAEASHAEALREADRMKSTLVSSVSHELKTPLAAATARVTGLIEEGDACDAQRVRDELLAVANDLGRLNDSIGDLLDLSRLESDEWQPRFEEHEIRDILGTVLARLPADQRSRIRFELAHDVPDVRVDFAQIARAISNVVENALAYSPADAVVTVGAEARHGAVELWIEDRGPGVPDVEKPYVFDKFYRGSSAEHVPSGTGLGLAIAREIVRTHDGTMRVEDAAGHGARFVLSIPAVRGDR